MNFLPNGRNLRTDQETQGHPEDIAVYSMLKAMHTSGKISPDTAKKCFDKHPFEAGPAYRILSPEAQEMFLAPLTERLSFNQLVYIYAKPSLVHLF